MPLRSEWSFMQPSKIRKKSFEKIHGDVVSVKAKPFDSHPLQVWRSTLRRLILWFGKAISLIWSHHQLSATNCFAMMSIKIGKRWSQILHKKIVKRILRRNRGMMREIRSRKECLKALETCIPRKIGRIWLRNGMMINLPEKEYFTQPIQNSRITNKGFQVGDRFYSKIWRRLLNVNNLSKPG